MTDDIMKDLVTKHDAVITSLVASVEHLVKSQTDTNKKLEEITKLLTKQVLLSNRIEAMDKELTESFKRVHHRIDDMDKLQKSDNGCNSVRLLTKDIEALTRDTIRLVGSVEDQRQHLEAMQKIQTSYPSTTAIRWGVGILIAYSITFGTYVVQSISGLTQTDARVLTLLERDIRDTAILMDNLKIKKDK